MTQPVVLTDETFENEVLNAGQPVLVDFWAPWCAPCRMVAPTIDALADAYEGRAKIAKLNVQEHQEIARALQVMSIPTVAVFNGNHVVDYRVGAQSEQTYHAMLDKALSEDGASDAASA